MIVDSMSHRSPTATYLYINGWGAVPEVLSEIATYIDIQPSEIESVVAGMKRYGDVDFNMGLKYYDAGRCYALAAILDCSIFMRVAWEMWSMESQLSSSSNHQPCRRWFFHQYQQLQ